MHMADDETNQLLRELMAIQKEHLDLVRRTNEAYEKQTQTYDQSLVATQRQNDEQIRQMHERYEKQAQAYDRSVARYEESIRTTSTANNIANVLRAVALVVMAAVLAYLVLFGLHRH
jgi:cytochrome c-type biogenesis protein CcmH/NrfG